jgi:hypothetical protein
MLHIDLLENADLDVIDVIPVPNRLEDAIQEPEIQNVLSSVLSKIMVYAINLILLKHPM